MSDPYVVSDDGQDAPSPFSAVAPDPGTTNPALARDFLSQHRGAMDSRTKEIDNIFSKQQLNTESMTRMLDDTTNALKASRQNRSNLPMMAMAAGLLSGKGNFGSQLGEGFRNMVPTIQKDRNEDEDFQFKLAQLQMRRAGVENAPLHDKLAYMRALQTGDQSAIRGIETMLLKTQGTDATKQAKLDQAKEAADQKAIYNALQEARRQTDAFFKDQTPDPEERDAATRQRFSEMAKSMGVSDDSIKKFAPTMAPAASGAPGAKPPVYKGGFKTPTDAPADLETAKNLGMPPKPTGYVYDAITSPTDKLKTYQTERQNFEKEQKTWDVELDKNMTELTNLDRAQALLKKYPGSTGPVGGVLPNSWQLPSSVRQELSSVFASNAIHSVPQGQGAISDYERSLFNKANPSMEHNADVNQNLMNVRRQIINDQLEKRKFITEYFGHYKTAMGADQAWAEYARSPEGRAGEIDPKTNQAIPNPARISWKQFMAKKWGDQPQAHARGGQHNESITLGDEWDD